MQARRLVSEALEHRTKTSHARSCIRVRSRKGRPCGPRRGFALAKRCDLRLQRRDCSGSQGVAEAGARLTVSLSVAAEDRPWRGLWQDPAASVAGLGAAGSSSVNATSSSAAPTTTMGRSSTGRIRARNASAIAAVRAADRA
jgi:hypothetical protein